MKHLNYRLLACFLSLWMLLSAFTPLASALPMSEVSDYGEYSATGEVTSQGPMPADIIDIKLPTARAGVLDVKLDPNNVLRNLKDYKINGKVPKIGAGRVFFTNIDQAGNISLIRNSERLQIVNKGNVPLTVKMSVNVNKGDNNFTFASAPNFTDEKGKAISGPAFYLALTTGGIRTPVLPIMEKDEETGRETLTGYGATSTGWIPNNEGAYYLAGNRSTNQYYYAMTPGFNEADFTSTTFYMTGAINDTGWDSNMSNFDLTITWNVTKEKGPDTDPNEEVDVAPWADTLFAAANASDAADLYVNYGSGANRMNAVTGIAYTSADGDAVTLSASDAGLTVEGSYVSVPSTSEIYSGSNWMLTMSGASGATTRVPFALKETNVPLPEAEVGEASPSITVTKAAKNQDEWVEMDVNLGSLSRVVSLSYLMSNGEEGTVVHPEIIKINGTSVKVKAFMGAWTSSEYCRLNLEGDDGSCASVSFDLRTEGKLEQPVVVTTKKASAQDEFAVLKVYMNNMTNITGLKYRLSNRTYGNVSRSIPQIFPETELPEVQVKAFLGVWNGDYPSLVFTNDDGDTFAARFAIK